MKNFTIYDGEDEIAADTILDLDKDCWSTSNGVNIISLVGIKKIFNALNLSEKKFEFNVVPTEGNKQQHVVSIWVGKKTEDNPNSWTRGTGEASMLNTGEVTTDKNGKRKYEEFTHIDSKYRAAMAEKRALSRAVLAHAKLHNIYGAVEAKDFARPSAVDGYDY